MVCPAPINEMKLPETVVSELTGDEALTRYWLPVADICILEKLKGPMSLTGSKAPAVSGKVNSSMSAEIGAEPVAQFAEVDHNESA